MTEYLPILAMGAFGMVLAVASHFSLARERKALLDARARLAEEKVTPEETEAEGKLGRAFRHTVSVSGRRANGRLAQFPTKQYRRVRGKP